MGETVNKANRERILSYLAVIIPAAAVLFVVAVLIVRVFIINVVVVAGGSMEPTMNRGERWLVSRLDKSCDRGDVIVYKTSEDDENLSVSRVIAVAGDTVYIDFSSGAVYVNGEKADPEGEPVRTGGKYISSLIEGGSYGMAEPIVIESGKVFVMGDNHNNSRDSREFGQIPLDFVRGTVFRKFK